MEATILFSPWRCPAVNHGKTLMCIHARKKRIIGYLCNVLCNSQLKKKNTIGNYRWFPHCLYLSFFKFATEFETKFHLQLRHALLRTFEESKFEESARANNNGRFHKRHIWHNVTQWIILSLLFANVKQKWFTMSSVSLARKRSNSNKTGLRRCLFLGSVLYLHRKVITRWKIYRGDIATLIDICRHRPWRNSYSRIAISRVRFGAKEKKRRRRNDGGRSRNTSSSP